MKPKIMSAYQKMYLVTPSVYQKLLNCIEEKDIRATEELNMPKPPEEIKTPSERLLEEISGRDVGIQVQPETSEMGVQVGGPLPTVADISTETEIPVVQPMFTQTEVIPTEPMYTQTEIIPTQPIATQTEIIPAQPIATQTMTPIAIPTAPISTQTEVYENVLRQPCPQETSQGSVIPSLFYKPSIPPIKTKRFARPITKPLLASALQQIQIQPQQQTIPTEIFTDPNLPVGVNMQPTVKLTRLPPHKLVGLPTKILTSGKPSFACSACGKKYTRKHDLKRHLESKNVHKDFTFTMNPETMKLPPNLTAPTQQPNPIVGPEETFEFYQTNPAPGPSRTLRPRAVVPGILTSQKRSAGKAKLGRPRFVQKRRPASSKEGEEGEEEGGEKKEEFRVWN